MPKLGEILKPKLVKDILLDKEYRINGVGKICQAMTNYAKNREILLAIISDPEFDPNIHNGIIFFHACINNLSELVKLMLPRLINPTHNNNYALRIAYSRGCNDVINILLKDERVVKSLDSKHLHQLHNLFKILYE